MTTSKFWNWAENDVDERVLYLEGVISEETWWGDEVTPKIFRDDLHSGSGDITVWLNSPGGDCFAAAAIYTMLKEYPSKITVKISALAASAASVVAMAGDEVLMSPASMMMLHNPATIAIGDSEEMLKAKNMLDEIKESIINAYAAKSGHSRDTISNWMDGELWMDVNKAIRFGFADGMLSDPVIAPQNKGMVFSRKAVTASLLNKIMSKADQPRPGTLYDNIEKRLIEYKKNNILRK